MGMQVMHSLQNFARHIRHLAAPFILVRCCIPLLLLVGLEMYFFDITFPVSVCCIVQVVTSSYTVQD